MDIPVTIEYSDRKSLALQIKDGGVLARAPRGMSRDAVMQFVRSRESWIRRHLQEQARAAASPRLTAEELAKLAAQAKTDIPERVRRYAPLVGVTYGRITIRAQHTRWGSCSSQGNLNFNCLLMLAPPEVRDSVVVHELCHRKEMNHSPRFWAEVEKVDPDYKAHRKWLKDEGSKLIARMEK